MAIPAGIAETGEATVKNDYNDNWDKLQVSFDHNVVAAKAHMVTDAAPTCGAVGGALGIKTDLNRIVVLFSPPGCLNKDDEVYICVQVDGAVNPASGKWIKGQAVNAGEQAIGAVSFTVVDCLAPAPALTPTLSEWGIVVLAGSLLAVGVAAVARTRRG